MAPAHQIKSVVAGGATAQILTRLPNELDGRDQFTHRWPRARPSRPLLSMALCLVSWLA
jgi:hypothetical protein